MEEPNFSCVQCLAGDERFLILYSRRASKVAFGDSVLSPVEVIARDGQPDLGHVNTNLVGSAGNRPAFNQCMVFIGHKG